MRAASARKEIDILGPKAIGVNKQQLVITYLHVSDGLIFGSALLLGIVVCCVVYLIDKRAAQGVRPPERNDREQRIRQLEADQQQLAMLASYTIAVSVVRALIDARLVKSDQY